MPIQADIVTQESRRPRYLKLTGQPKPDKKVAYVYAALQRKVFLEANGATKRKALTTFMVGDPATLVRDLELYFIQDGDLARHALDNLKQTEIYKKLEDCCRDQPLKEETVWNTISYFSEPEPPFLLTREYPFLMYVSIRLHDPNELDTFCKLGGKVRQVFEEKGLHLFMAGWRHYEAGDQHVVEILNTWTFNDLEDVLQVMQRLADNEAYAELDRMCDQEQLVLWNMFRELKLPPDVGNKP